MVTTAGLHAVAGLTGYTDTPVAFTYIAYGSGTTAVATSDTALQTQVGSRVVATDEAISILKPNDTVRYSAQVLSTAAGTVSEIGVFTAATGGTMLSRRLVVPPITYVAGATVSLIATETVKNYACGTGATW